MAAFRFQVRHQCLLTLVHARRRGLGYPDAFHGYITP